MIFSLKTKKSAGYSFLSNASKTFRFVLLCFCIFFVCFVCLFVCLFVLFTNCGLPEAFSATRPQKGDMASLKRHIPWCLLPMYSYRSLLCIDAKVNSFKFRMTSLWRHNVSALSEFWTYSKYTQRIGKYQSSAKNRGNMRFSQNLFFSK